MSFKIENVLGSAYYMQLPGSLLKQYSRTYSGTSSFREFNHDVIVLLELVIILLRYVTKFTIRAVR